MSDSRRTLCPQCHYDLRALIESAGRPSTSRIVCSECGGEFGIAQLHPRDRRELDFSLKTIALMATPSVPPFIGLATLMALQPHGDHRFALVLMAVVWFVSICVLGVLVERRLRGEDTDGAHSLTFQGHAIMSTFLISIGSGVLMLVLSLIVIIALLELGIMR